MWVFLICGGQVLNPVLHISDRGKSHFYLGCPECSNMLSLGARRSKFVSCMLKCALADEIMTAVRFGAVVHPSACLHTFRMYAAPETGAVQMDVGRTSGDHTIR